MVLSRLHHSHIVRYFQAWVEDYINFDTAEDEEDDYEINEDSQTENENFSQISELSRRQSSQDDFIQFQGPKNINKNQGWEVEDDVSYNEALKKEKIKKLNMKSRA